MQIKFRKLYLVTVLTAAFLSANIGYAKPTIGYVTPGAGAAGSSVTINGSGFDLTPENNWVTLGGIHVTPTLTTETALTVTVPFGTNVSSATVSTSGLTAYSPIPFVPTFQGGGNLTSSSFASKSDLVAGGNVYSGSAGDLDNDGRPDLVVSNYNSNTISVYKNIHQTGFLSNASFSSRFDLVTGTNPTGVVIADLTGDGKPEIIVSNYNANTISVFPNIGTDGVLNASSFGAKVDFATNSGPISIATSDLNLDGLPEVIVANYGSDNISVFNNSHSSGGFSLSSLSSRQDFTTSSGPISVATSDIDGDFKPDVVAACYTGNKVSVFFNTSTPTLSLKNTNKLQLSSLALKVDFATGTNPTSVALNDFDANAKPEIVVSNFTSKTISIFKNKAKVGSITTSSFATKVDYATASQPRGLAIHDVDGDSRLDVVVANSGSSSVYAFHNSSTAGLLSFYNGISFSTSAQPRLAILSDFDMDGKPDLATPNYSSSSISLFHNAVTAIPPIATTDSATSIGGTFATLNGKVNPNGYSTVVYFEYGTTDSYGSTTMEQTIAGGNTEIPMFAFLSNLLPYTIYHYRIVAVSEIGTSYGGDFTFQTIAPVPSVVTLSPTNITSEGVTLNALVNPNGTDTTVYFEYGETDTYGSVTETFYAGAGMDALQISIDLSFLTPNTSYNFRAVAVNVGGSNEGLNFSFTTSPPLPFVMLEGATDITSDSATLNGVINPNGSDTNYYFQYKSFDEADYTTSTPLSNAGDGLEDEYVSADLLFLLSPNTLYSYRLIAVNAAGTAYSYEMQFATLPLPPVVNTAPPANVGRDYAELLGSIDTNGSDTQYFFEYGFDSSYGYSTTASVLSSSVGAINVSAIANNLMPNGVEYHFRLVATNAGGTSFSSDSVFKTGYTNPHVQMDPLVDSTLTTLLLGGSVLTNGSTTNVYLEYGLTDTYGFKTGDIVLENSADLVSFQQEIGNLEPNTEYHARFVASNLGGSTLTPDFIFRTSGRPAIYNLFPMEAKAGETLTIYGDGFRPLKEGNIVMVSNVRANVISANQTMLVVEIPFGASYGNVQVVVNSLVATSRLPFSLLFDNGALNHASFSNTYSLSSGFAPVDTASADFDADGKVDLAFVNQDDMSISIYRNTYGEDAMFEERVDLDTEYLPNAIATADFDRDGLLDIAVTNRDSDTVSVFRNNSEFGSISFDSQLLFNVGMEPVDLTVSDFNMDGRLDIAVVNGLSYDVSVLINVSAADTLNEQSFLQEVFFTIESGGISIDSADMNNDGRMDIVVANYFAGSVGVLLNAVDNSTGPVFFTSESLVYSASFGSFGRPGSILLADFNKDGWMDLSAVNDDSQNIMLAMNQKAEVGILLSEPSSVFVDGQMGDISVADADGDRFLDVIVSTNELGSFAILKGMFDVSTSQFSLQSTPFVFGQSASGVGHISASDLDSDGRIDFVVPSPEFDSASLFLNSNR